ncbi:MAG: tetratricopeptide repeat-containing glycosyltransferase family protein [Rhodospirillales bacterium]
MAKRTTGSSVEGPSSGPTGQARPSPAQFIIEQAIEHHQAGRLPDAAALYEQAIGIDPEAHVAIGMLGTVALQCGEFGRAHELLRHAIDVHPGVADYWFNDGLALAGQGDAAAAEDAVRRSLELAPNNAAALNQLGVLLRQSGDLEEAQKVLSRATRADPNMAEAWINLSSTLGDIGNLKEALTAARKALHRAPSHPRAHFNIGRIQSDLEEHEAARAAFEDSINLDPANADSWASLAKTLIALNRPIDAEHAAEQALALDESHQIGLCNMGLSLIRQARYPEALPYLREAVSIDPQEGTGVSNLACCLLALGEFDEGWPMYELMLRADRGRHTVFVQNSVTPVWQGEPLAGKSILLSAEQGIGEQIMFATMIDRLIADGARVGYVCDERLVPMIERSMPEVEPFAARIGDEEPEGFDFFLPIGSLASRLLRAPGDFPKSRGFLSPDETLIADLRERYREGHDGPVIGISWRSASSLVGIQKNAPLELWKPIFTLPNCRFVSIQYGDVREDVTRAKAELGVDIHVDEDVDAMKSIDQNAAQIAACDLVISISNATLHVAGACGIETLAIVGRDPNWYWCLEEERRSLWYHSVVIHRQAADEGWSPVIGRVADEARRYLGSS